MESSKFIEVGRIMETNDLSFFKPSILNRNISKSQINKLKKSIQNFGQQDEIKIKPDGTIIDGHHRYYAIKELNEQENADLMLKYTVIEAEDEINLIITMNSTHQDWGTADYINIYAKNNNKQYQKIIEIAKKYKQTTTSVLSTICFGSDIKRFREKIKNGEVLDFANWDLLEEYYQYLDTLKPFIVIKEKVKQMLFRLYTLKAFNPVSFYKNVYKEYVETNRKISFSLSQNACKEQLLWIYNKGKNKNSKSFINFHKDSDDKIIIDAK